MVRRGHRHQAKTQQERSVEPMRERKQKKVDKALDMTFPASDPPASNQSTGTETPGRPTSRQAPIVSKDDIDAAAGAKRPQGGRKARKRHRHVGSDVPEREDALDDTAEEPEPRPRRG
jgi:hypothetical protein